MRSGLARPLPKLGGSDLSEERSHVSQSRVFPGRGPRRLSDGSRLLGLALGLLCIALAGAKKGIACASLGYRRASEVIVVVSLTPR